MGVVLFVGGSFVLGTAVELSATAMLAAWPLVVAVVVAFAILVTCGFELERRAARRRRRRWLDAAPVALFPKGEQQAGVSLALAEAPRDLSRGARAASDYARENPGAVVAIGLALGNALLARIPATGSVPRAELERLLASVARGLAPAPQRGWPELQRVDPVAVEPATGRLPP